MRSACRFLWPVAVGLSFAAMAECRAAEEGPHVFWASDPVRPDEAVLVQGSQLGGPEAIVEMARLDDRASSGPGSALVVKEWPRLSVLQGSGQSVKFVVPPAWPIGV